MLSPTVGRLQWDAARSKRGPDLHDGAVVAGPHSQQGRPGPVDEPQIADLGDALELIRADLGKGCENRGERGVHPDVDRAEAFLDLPCRVVDLSVVGHVRADGERLAACPLHVVRRAVQAGPAAGDQPDAGATLAVKARDSAADARARSRDDNRLSHWSRLLTGRALSPALPRHAGFPGQIRRYPCTHRANGRCHRPGRSVNWRRSRAARRCRAPTREATFTVHGVTAAARSPRRTWAGVVWAVICRTQPGRDRTVEAPCAA